MSRSDARVRSQPVLLLDVGGVLLLPAFEPVAEALEAVGFFPDLELLDLAHYTAIKAVDEWSDDAFLVRYCSAYSRALAVPEELQENADAALRTLFAVPGAWTKIVESSLIALRSIADLRVPVAIVSNTHGDMAERLTALGICQVGEGHHVRVEAILDSEVVRVPKPDPRIFHMALDALDSVPEAALHVGDSVYFDVNGAKAVGIEAVHVDPYRLCTDTSHEHIGSLMEVVSRF
ncbi:MAG: HAD hydrolase-like protein [Actinomycetota bacterium]|nr:HAD hydrolase-like protein [Actinomycetota bacterium]